jgi:hypothetical protein
VIRLTALPRATKPLPGALSGIFVGSCLIAFGVDHSDCRVAESVTIVVGNNTKEQY